VSIQAGSDARLFSAPTAAGPDPNLG